MKELDRIKVIQGKLPQNIVEDIEKVNAWFKTLGREDSLIQRYENAYAYKVKMDEKT